MISEKKIASIVSERILEASRSLDEAVAVVHAHCPPAESSAFRLAMGHILADLLLNVLNPLYREHPDIRPKELDVPAR